MELQLPHNILTRRNARSFLSEDDFILQFSVKEKIYYNLIRPILPIFIRHFFQKFRNSKVNYRNDFIEDGLVRLLQENEEEWRSFIRDLYPENSRCAIVVTHDVETQKGFDFIPKVIESEQKYNFVSSWNIIPYKYDIAPDIINTIIKNGNEIGIHGYNHDGKLYYSRKIFDKRVPYINEAIEKYDAVGFRSPMVHRNLEWLQKLNIVYDASCFDYDPFQPFPGGTGSIWPFIAGKFIELPYTLPQDHTLFCILKVKDISIWKNKTDWLVNNHGVVLSLTHPDYLIKNDNLKYYEEFLAFLASIKNTWHCLPRDLAFYWKDRFNPIGSDQR